MPKSSIRELRRYLGGSINIVDAEPITTHNPDIKIRKSGDTRSIYTKLKDGTILKREITTSGDDVDVPSQQIYTGSSWNDI